MANQTQICNMALRRVGDKRIQNITESSPTANLLLDIYDIVLEETLRLANWNCAIAYSEFEENATTPPYEWAHSFSLPENPKCLRVIQMEDEDSVFKVVGRNLYTNEATCKAKFIKLVTDSTEFDALFIKTFYLSLAVSMAYNRTGTNTVKNGLMKELDDTVAEAKGIDALEGDPDQPRYSTWIAARVIGTRGRFRGANSGRW